MALLEVRDLRVAIRLEAGEAAAVDGISFDLAPGRVLGLVGESGCGKSMTALALMRLLPPAARITGGTARLGGRDVLSLPERELQRIRGAEMAMIFQEPMTALNPVMTVGAQVAEAVRLHQPIGRRAAWDRAVALLGEVGIPDPAQRATDHPHRLSGGMRQRVMIAMAISCEPGVLIADEPTTALDVTIQASILELLGRLRRERGMAVLLITHDLGVVAEEADEVAIMYAGRIIEQAAVADIFARPRHPYTVALLASMPRLGAPRARLDAIPGQVPGLGQGASGCSFRDRCRHADAACATEPPPLRELAAAHRVACVHA